MHVSVWKAMCIVFSAQGRAVEQRDVAWFRHCHLIGKRKHLISETGRSTQIVMCAEWQSCEPGQSA